MAPKSTCWFSWIKRLFISEPTTEPGKKPKKWRWFFRRFKAKKHPAIVASDRTLDEAIEEQRKHAVTVANATAAAARAAVAAARAASEVVRLTAGASRAYHNIHEGDPDSAAVRIQSAFRAYLARKALRALKGVVRLQAIVRGQAVRRRTLIDFSPTRIQRTNGSTETNISERKESGSRRANSEPVEKETVIEHNSSRYWDCSTYSKSDIEANWLKKQEAVSERERMKKYSYSFQERRHPKIAEEWILNEDPGRRSCRLEQSLSAESKSCDSESKPWASVKATIFPNRTAEEIYQSIRDYKLGFTRTESPGEALSVPRSLPRRSFCQVKQLSVAVDESNLPSSPVFPSYMGTTESRRAKTQSLSTPKQRVGSFDARNDQSSWPFRGSHAL